MLKIKDESVQSTPRTAREIPMGTVFRCKNSVYGDVVAMRAYQCLVCLNSARVNTGDTWPLDTDIYDYQPLDATLVIHGAAKE